VYGRSHRAAERGEARKDRLRKRVRGNRVGGDLLDSHGTGSSDENYSKGLGVDCPVPNHMTRDPF